VSQAAGHVALAQGFKPHLRPLVDAIESSLMALPPSTFAAGDRVVYVTDTSPEMKQGKTDMPVMAWLMAKADAIKDEMRRGSPASLTLAAKMRETQAPYNFWIIASDAANNIQICECVAVPFAPVAA